MKKLLNFLKQPYPRNDNSWQSIIIISLFVPIFLIVFRPFGINLYFVQNEFLIIAGYGIVTFILASLNQLLLPVLFPRLFREKSWNIGKNILRILFTIFTIGLGNYIYTGIVFSVLFFDFESIAFFQFITLSIAIIPVSIITVWRYNSLLIRNLKAADVINSQLTNQVRTNNQQSVQIFAENEKDFIEINLSDLQFIESNGNYIEVSFIIDGSSQVKSLRSTLKRVEVILSNYPSIIRCHRAFCVNVNKVTNVKGNSQGYRLCIENSNKEIPVARNYAKQVKDLFNPLSK